MVSQALLFTEPTFSETGVWCELNSEIDPAEWAYVCRFIGKLSQQQFEYVVNTVKSQVREDKTRAERLTGFRAVPLVSIGCSGIGGEYQMEVKVLDKV
ncbi:MAG: hypothetical protein EHM20_06640 [Alphaproteobacteria bacterium]|nr:MAG: hypothetical protein EHM20_06640 [Alphaproteobacteria bacterium]